jgi:hypothetical protein
VNDAVVPHGEALVEAGTERTGAVDALGLDETLFNRTGKWRTQQWCTSVVDVGGPGRSAQLIDIVEGTVGNQEGRSSRRVPERASARRDDFRMLVATRSRP